MQPHTADLSPDTSWTPAATCPVPKTSRDPLILCFYLLAPLKPLSPTPSLTRLRRTSLSLHSEPFSITLSRGSGVHDSIVPWPHPHWIQTEDGPLGLAHTRWYQLSSDNLLLKGSLRPLSPSLQVILGSLLRSRYIFLWRYLTTSVYR